MSWAELVGSGLKLSIAVSATDNCDANLAMAQTPAGSTWQLGATSVTHTATDDTGNIGSCGTVVTVADAIKPEIQCNESPITPPDAPTTFTATATDNCSVSNVAVTSYDCWKLNGAGKKVDKKGSCVVAYNGADLTISDVGGVGTTIEWTVSAVDGSGNTITKLCSLVVQHPGNGGGNTGCNQGVGNGAEGCDPGNSNQGDDDNSNDENGGTPGNPGKSKGKK